MGHTATQEDTGAGGLLIPLPVKLLADLATLAALEGYTLAEYTQQALDRYVNGRRAVLDALHEESHGDTNGHTRDADRT
jgi:hypothetical protein